MRNRNIAEYQKPCLAVYCSLIRSILEYASIVFANLPQYLSNALENIQKSALGIIVPSMPYSQALHLTGLPSLQERRESACIRFISKISPGNPLYALILSRSQPRESPYNLRRNTNIVSKQTNTDRFAQCPLFRFLSAFHSYFVLFITLDSRYNSVLTAKGSNKPIYLFI